MAVGWPYSGFFKYLLSFSGNNYKEILWNYILIRERICELFGFKNCVGNYTLSWLFQSSHHINSLPISQNNFEKLVNLQILIKNYILLFDHYTL